LSMSKDPRNQCNALGNPSLNKFAVYPKIISANTPAGVSISVNRLIGRVIRRKSLQATHLTNSNTLAQLESPRLEYPPMGQGNQSTLNTFRGSRKSGGKKIKSNNA